MVDSQLGWVMQQGASSQASLQMVALECQQDAMEEKMTEVLAKTTTTTKAIEDLKTLLTKYMERKDDGENDTPLVSKSQLDSPIHIPACTMQEVHLVDALLAGGQDVDRGIVECALEDLNITSSTSG